VEKILMLQFKLIGMIFLPRNYKYYNVTFSLQTAPVFFKMIYFYANCEINCDIYAKIFSFDTSTKASSITLGYAQRDIQTALSKSSKNTFACFLIIIAQNR
jgi:hypothetical protein